MGAGAAAGLRKARARCRDGVPGMRWCLLALPSQLAFLAASPGALGRRLPGRARQELPSHSPLVCSPGLIFRRLRRQRQGNCSPRAGRCYGWFLGGRWEKLEGRRGGKREEGGECRGRPGKLRAAFPPQSVERERGGARRWRRPLRHQTPGAQWGSGPPPPQRGKPSPNRFRPDLPPPHFFLLPLPFFFFFFKDTYFWLRTSDCLLQPKPS